MSNPIVCVTRTGGHIHLFSRDDHGITLCGLEVYDFYPPTARPLPPHDWHCARCAASATRDELQHLMFAQRRRNWQKAQAEQP